MWADSAYAGKLVDWAKQHLNLTIKPVSRPKDTSGFVMRPRLWIVERSLAWMMHARRHARDYERLIQHSETLITWTAITLMIRRLARKAPPQLAEETSAGRHLTALRFFYSVPDPKTGSPEGRRTTAKYRLAEPTRGGGL
ncbi:hypothetical protein Sliba_79270 [Streptomyces nigrescens]|uniref:Transposase DDE domain-containing protein n=1 Tax=Streptomyces nigrescens TaxID=1920 RepID=A0A640TWC1_STRNI|nr:hypothetical protein Sliba_79270 [Streptomyces libani subsp. libani]GGV96044.1 hypothetical protein GCM10010500_37800 [Streptomyces libani subsp. libani]